MSDQRVSCWNRIRTADAEPGANAQPTGHPDRVPHRCEVARALILRSRRPESLDDASDATAARERRIEQLIDRLPNSWRSSARWLRRPSQRLLRICAGLLLIVGSFLSILPMFGLWMLPVGLVLLSEDVPVLRQAIDRVLEWVERRRPQWLHSHPGG
jgi:hypothetical protein